MKNATLNGYRFAELAIGESLQSPDTCDCCGREGLNRTVKLVNPAGCVVWFGTGCAARAMSIGIDEVRVAQKDAESRSHANVRKAAEEVFRAQDAAWQDFLNREAGYIYQWERGPVDRFAQICKLGGMSAAKALFETRKKES